MGFVLNIPYFLLKYSFTYYYQSWNSLLHCPSGLWFSRMWLSFAPVCHWQRTHELKKKEAHFINASKKEIKVDG